MDSSQDTPMDTGEISTEEQEIKEVEISQTSKGKETAFVDGFSYLNDKKRESNYYWRCNNFYTHRCKARLQTKFEGGKHIYSTETGEHCHPPSATLKGKRDAISEIKRRASTSKDKTCSIINEVQASTSSFVQGELPRMSAQKQICRRARKKDEPLEPKNLMDLVIPEDLLENIGGGQYVISDITQGTGRIHILSSAVLLEHLSRTPIIIMDGTFYTAPALFYQIYTMFGMVGNGAARKAFPLVFVLMTAKSTIMYRKVFQELKSYFIRADILFEPRHFLTDFEKAAIKACAIEFPAATNHGCLFHFGQIIYRAIMSHGLKARYGKDEEFNSNVRMIIALAFLDPDEIPEMFEEVVLWMGDEDDVSQFINWFRNNYVAKHVDDTSTQSQSSLTQFSQEFWSVKSLVELGLPRTQNSVEAWHRRFKTLVDVAHPGVFALMKKLREEIHYQTGLIDRAIRDEKPDYLGKVYEQREKEIVSIVRSKDSISTQQYLFAISQKIKGLIDM